MATTWNTKFVDWFSRERMTRPNTENTAWGTTNQISELAIRDEVFHMVIK